MTTPQTVLIQVISAIWAQTAVVKSYRTSQKETKCFILFTEHNKVGYGIIWFIYEGGISMIPCQGSEAAFWLIQSYWIAWLLLSFIISIVLGATVLCNWEIVK